MNIDWNLMSELPYDQVEHLFIGIIGVKARKWIGKMGGDGSTFALDDFVQEGRIAASKIWETFDPSRGSFVSYLGMMLDNNFKGLLDREMASKRCPYVARDDGTKGPARPMSLDATVGDDACSLMDLVPSSCMNPEEHLMYSDMAADVAAIGTIIKAGLTRRQRQVFACVYEDNEAFHRYVRSKGKPLYRANKRDIAEYLGLTHSQVELETSKIRRSFQLLRGELS